MSTHMPLQLTNLLLNVPENYSEMFSDLFRRLPQKLYTLFSNCLASTLDVVPATLPPALTSHLPENLAFSPYLHIQITELRSFLTIWIGTMCTIVAVFVPSPFLSRWVSILFTAMNAGLYVNPSLDLPALLNTMDTNFTNSITPQPFSELTNLPYELFSMLNNTLPSALHPFLLEIDNHLVHLLYEMTSGFNSMIMQLIEQLHRVLGDSPAAPDYHLEKTTVQYVYQAREDTGTDPDKCSVCLEEMKDGDNARRLRCLHDFHMDCIDRWLNTNKTCPICRTHISTTH